MSFSTATVLGNMTRDPEVREVGETMVCNFTVATNKRFTDRNGELQEKPAFIDCSAWGRTAEVIGDHFVKGQQILVSGEIEQDHWENDDGEKRSKLKVRVFSFSFTGTKAENEKLREERDEEDDEFDGDEADIPF